MGKEQNVWIGGQQASSIKVLFKHLQKGCVQHNNGKKMGSQRCFLIIKYSFIVYCI